MFVRSHTPPVAKQVPVTHTIHGVTRTDEYHWLREKDNPEVRSYLEDENSYADRMAAHLAEKRHHLYNELIGRIQQTDLSVPYRKGNFSYYMRTEEGKQYSIHCRKPIGSDVEEIVIDGNKMSEGHAFFSLGTVTITDCGRYLAYSVDTTGFRDYQLHVRDLETGLDIASFGKARGIIWANDSDSLYIVTEDDAKRSDTIWRTSLSNPTERTIVFHEPDALFRVFATKTRDNAFIVLGTNSQTTSEFYTIPADDPKGTPMVVLPREDGHEYDLDHRDGLFYIRTNKNAPLFRIVAAPVSDPQEENWTEVLGADTETMRESVDCFGGHLVISERCGGRPQLRVLSFATGQDQLVAFPEPTYTVTLDQNHCFDTTTLRISYSSLVMPSSIYDVNLDTLELTLLKQTAILGGFDTTNYVSSFLHATAPDGTRVPVSIVHHKDTPINGTAPCLLYGYGSYGITIPVQFQSSLVSLLDRGFVYAIGHIRGGGDLGKTWHDAGKMQHKQNTFSDFIAVGDFLKSEGYAHSNRLAIRGGSAGGLLLGAVVNQRPDLCRLVMNYVPFVDVINTMLDDTLPLTVGEYIEWGNPNIEEEYHWMQAYSPYDNLEAKDYPSTLVRTGYNDSQVMYWEPAKYVARKRRLKTDSNTLLFITDLSSGHGGASGRYDAMRDLSWDYTWLCDQLDVQI